MRINIGIAAAVIAGLAIVAAVLASPDGGTPSTSGSPAPDAPANVIIDADQRGAVIRSSSGFAGIDRAGKRIWSAPDLLTRQPEMACYGGCPAAIAWGSDAALGHPEVADPPIISFTPRREVTPIVVGRVAGKRLFGHVRGPADMVYVDASLRGAQTLHLVAHGARKAVPVSGVVDVRAYVNDDTSRVFVALDSGAAGVSGTWYERRGATFVSRGTVAGLPSPYGCADPQLRAVTLVGPKPVRIAYAEATGAAIHAAADSGACHQEADGTVFVVNSVEPSGSFAHLVKVEGAKPRWSRTFASASVSGAPQSALTSVVANNEMTILDRAGKTVMRVAGVDDARIVGAQRLVVALPSGQVRFSRLAGG